jgi:hypothetical protein
MKTKSKIPKIFLKFQSVILDFVLLINDLWLEKQNLHIIAL